MVPDHQGGGPSRFKVKVLFGLLETDATGPIAIGATILVVVMVGVGRYYTLW